MQPASSERVRRAITASSQGPAGPSGQQGAQGLPGEDGAPGWDPIVAFIASGGFVINANHPITVTTELDGSGGIFYCIDNIPFTTRIGGQVTAYNSPFDSTIPGASGTFYSGAGISLGVR